MKDSSIDSRYHEDNPELAKVSDKQLPKVDLHAAGAIGDEVVPAGATEHGFGVTVKKEKVVEKPVKEVKK